MSSTHSTISSQRQSVVLLPIGITRSSSDFGVEMTLTKSTVLPSRGSHPTELAMLVHSLAEPVDTSVPADSFVLGIHQDHLKELVRGVLAHPVRVEDTQGSAVAPSSFLNTHTINITIEQMSSK